MSETIQKLTIEGFKSIRKLEDFELRSLNVLIGANGAGKSNFVSFFRLLRELIEQRLQVAVATEGGADACLYLGPKITQRFVAKLYFGYKGYEFALVPTIDNRFVFAEETIISRVNRITRTSLGSGNLESKLRVYKEEPGAWDAWQDGAPNVFDAISSWVVYHFHDTSLTASVRRQRPLNDNVVLRPSAENLAAFLYRIRDTNSTAYTQIRDVVRLAAPFFDDFRLRPVPTSPDMIQLEWQQKDSDYPFLANQLSDGTLRFICLATALLQPQPPPTILFDEPELGLHPYALTLLGNLFRLVAQRQGKQIIISTQSAPLLNEFAPEDVIVVERHLGESTFRRLESAQLSEWLQDYTLGELWQKNVLGGRPSDERTPEFASDGGKHDS
ncbi:MAG TPA: AAA family ATPase [Bryobacteraceae bacterium]|jgi:predicted ATPase|nr:AAA family ATPase [Bryobacteraceae bacterium]